MSINGGLTHDKALHLLWIIPISAWFGFAVCAVLVAGKRGESKKEV